MIGLVLVGLVVLPLVEVLVNMQTIMLLVTCKTALIY